MSRQSKAEKGLVMSMLSRALGLNEAEVSLFTTRRDSDAGIFELWGLEHEMERALLIFGELPLVQKKLALSVEEMRELLFQDLSDAELEAGAAASSFINRGAGPAGTYLKIKVTTPPDHPPGKPGSPDLVRRSDGTTWDYRQLDRVMRFTRLAQRVGMSFTDLDGILQSARCAELDERALQVVAIALEIQRKYGLTIDEIGALWAPP